MYRIRYVESSIAGNNSGSILIRLLIHSIQYTGGVRMRQGEDVNKDRGRSRPIKSKFLLYSPRSKSSNLVIDRHKSACY
jgi:hypothetical protein